MEFRINRDEFLKVVNIAQSVAIVKGSMPILSHLLLEARGDRIFLFGSDLDLGIKGETEAQIQAEGSICLSAKMLTDILRELPAESEVHLSLEENNQVTILCNKIRFHLVGLPVEDFPPFPVFEGEIFTLPKEVLQDMIVKIGLTVPAVEQKHLGAPNGALIEITEELTEMLGTDGHRLSYIKKPGIKGLKEKIKAILPKKFMVELKKILDDASGIDQVSFILLENKMLFKIGSIEIFTCLLEKRFPNIRQRIIKENDKILLINRMAFRQAVRRVSIFTEEKERFIMVKLEGGVLHLSSQNLGIGDAQDQLPVDYQGEALEIGFNSNFILDVLTILGGESVVLELSDHESHGVIRDAQNRDYLYIIMPVKLYEEEYDEY